MIDENMKKGSLVGYISTRDPDKVEIHSYLLNDYTNYPDNFNFEIVKN